MGTFLIATILQVFVGQISEPQDHSILNRGAQPKPKEAPVSRIFIPKGFDDNDTAQIIITGNFADDRHRVTGVKIQRDPLRPRIYYKVEALEYPTPTGEESMEYLQVVDLGILSKDNYQVLPQSKSDVEDIEKLGPVAGILKVKHTNSPRRDDYIYAAVDSAAVFKDADGLRREIRVFGTKNNSCLQFDGKMIDRIGFKKTDDQLIEILPIMLKESGTCYKVNEPFEYSFFVPFDIPSDRYLLHIRTYDGNSFNKLAEIKTVAK